MGGRPDAIRARLVEDQVLRVDVQVDECGSHASTEKPFVHPSHPLPRPARLCRFRRYAGSSILLAPSRRDFSATHAHVTFRSKPLVRPVDDLSTAAYPPFVI